MKNCGSKPRAFHWPCEHSTTDLPSHPVISPTTFHLNPTWLHTYPGTLNSSTNFLRENPRISYILPQRTYRLNHLSTVGFLCWEPFATGEKLWLDRGSIPGPFADHVNTLPLSYQSYHHNPTRLHKVKQNPHFSCNQYTSELLNMLGHG